MGFWVSAAMITYSLKPAEIYFCSLCFCCKWRELLLYLGREKCSSRNHERPAVGWTAGVNGIKCWSSNRPHTCSQNNIRVKFWLWKMELNFAHYWNFSCFLSFIDINRPAHLNVIRFDLDLDGNELSVRNLTSARAYLITGTVLFCLRVSKETEWAKICFETTLIHIKTKEKAKNPTGCLVKALKHQWRWDLAMHLKI